MSSSSLDDLIQSALAHHQARRIDEAEAAYHQVLAIEPMHPDALHYLGVLLYQKGRHGEAWELLKKAIALSPDTPHYYCNAAPVLLAMGRTDDAITVCRRALTLR